MSTLLAAMNHQPVLLPVVERGVSDDTIYFTVAGAGQSTNTTTPTPTNTPQPSQPASSSPPIATHTASPGNATETCD
ncbi:hypothetical protein JVT61DRAFT_9323 [Boletus reticuloceps]|uniref:Uncharacterized protein n=1 Tax=Boletus reticuloceps TaxID=495285 RepID=A0A8I2YGP2_9AGAM|nr:hypothetical protein JVT61DRAFT_9323 [Boletus reticuloceps]